MDFVEALDEFPVILAEGAVTERLRREFAVPLDPFINHAGFIYDSGKRAVLHSIYRQYIELAASRDLPILTMTPTRRADPGRIASAGFQDRDVNGDCVRFLRSIRAECGEPPSSVYIGGLMGCEGDAYNGREALAPREARDFHACQADRLAGAGVDFLFGATLPAVSEAIGLAEAMAQTGEPYILSFVIRPDGTLLDGTLLHDAMAGIDGQVSPKPAGYMVNCVHPSILLRALAVEGNANSLVRRRLIGIQGNASAKSPEELDGADELAAEDIGDWVDGMERLRREHRLRVFGGCCGTDSLYIGMRAGRLPGWA